MGCRAEGMKRDTVVQWLMGSTTQFDSDGVYFYFTSIPEERERQREREGERKTQTETETDRETHRE